MPTTAQLQYLFDSERNLLAKARLGLELGRRKLAAAAGTAPVRKVGGPIRVGDTVQYRLFNTPEGKFYGPVKTAVVVEIGPGPAYFQRGNKPGEKGYAVEESSNLEPLWLHRNEIQRIVQRGKGYVEESSAEGEGPAKSARAPVRKATRRAARKPAADPLFAADQALAAKYGWEYEGDALRGEYTQALSEEMEDQNTYGLAFTIAYERELDEDGLVLGNEASYVATCRDGSSGNNTEVMRGTKRLGGFDTLIEALTTCQAEYEKLVERLSESDMSTRADWEEYGKFPEAIYALADDKLREGLERDDVLAIVSDAVAAKITTDKSALDDWLAEYQFTGTETAEQLAKEYDEAPEEGADEAEDLEAAAAAPMQKVNENAGVEGLCACSDSDTTCPNEATTRLYQMNAMDSTGTPMCAECTDNALESGLFTEEPPPGDETDEDRAIMQEILDRGEPAERFGERQGISDEQP